MGAGRFIGMPSALVGAVACALLLVGGAAPAQTSKRSAAELMDAVMWNREPIGGPFQLTDQSGKMRSERDFRGHLMLVYFGFTTCPDICPTDLQAIAQTLDKLGNDAASVQPLFVTVDPERDTAEHLAEYVKLFHPHLIGLTGSLDAVRKAASAYKVYFAKVAIGKEANDYTVDHTAFIYLMDRDGNYLGFFPPGTSADRMVEIIRPRLAEPAR